MLPINLLTAAQGQVLLIELKDGTSFNGTLVNTDSFMNINLKEVTCTSKEGDRFWSIPECYVRGNTIKYFRLPDDVFDSVPDDDGSSSRSHRGRGGAGQRSGGLGRGTVRGGSSTRGRFDNSRGRGTPNYRGRGGGNNSNDRERGTNDRGRGSNRGAPHTRGTATRGGSASRGAKPAPSAE